MLRKKIITEAVKVPSTTWYRCDDLFHHIHYFLSRSTKQCTAMTYLTETSVTRKDGKDQTKTTKQSFLFRLVVFVMLVKQVSVSRLGPCSSSQQYIHSACQRYDKWKEVWMQSPCSFLRIKCLRFIKNIQCISVLNNCFWNPIWETRNLSLPLAKMFTEI